MAGARSPEELDVLLEDAFVAKRQEALLDLFDEAAVCFPAARSQPARGRETIASQISQLWWQRDYLAQPQRVLQARDTALVLSEGSLSVMRRGADRSWRYVILLLSNAPEAAEKGELP